MILVAREKRKREERTINIPNSALTRVSIYNNIYQVLRNSAHLSVPRRSVNRIRRSIYGADVRVPPTFLKHGIRFDLVPIESNERVLQLMPLNRRHRLRDIVRTTPAVFGNRGYSLRSPRCRHGVEDVTLFVRDV